MKEEAVTSSFDNLKCLHEAIYMIILNSKKINTNFKNTLNFYQTLNNYGALQCPFCQSSNLIRWGFYERNVIYFDAVLALTSTILKVQRVKCKSCSKTHALLLFGIIPYKQFASEIVSTILFKSTFLSIASLSIQYSLDQNIILKWLHDFKHKHLSRAIALLQITCIHELLRTLLTDSLFQQHYLLRYRLCFMQIKKSIIGLCSS